MTSKVVGGKRMAIALQALEQKINAQGLGLRVGFLENATYAKAAAVRLSKFKNPPKTKAGKRTRDRLTNALLSQTEEGDALHVAQVAFWNEYGTATAPARPFFRTTIAERSGDWGDVFKAGLKLYAMDGRKALRLLGQSMRDDIESAIAQWDSPSNADSTVARKGFDKPLVDTGIMQRAVDYEVAGK